MKGIRLTKTLSGWAAANDFSREHHRKAKFDVEYGAEIVKPREGVNLRKWWALCNLVYENFEKYKSPDQVHQHLKILCGHCTELVSKSTGEVYHIADSIDYATLDESEFMEVFNRAVAAVCEHILPGVTSRNVEHEIMRLLSRVGDVRAA